MLRTVNYSTVFLIAAIALFTAGCAGQKASPIDKETSAFDNLRTNVQEVVADPDRTEQSLALVDELQQEFDAIKDARVERRKQIQALNADYDAPRAEFEALLIEIGRDRVANQERVSQTYRKLLEVITTEEWAKLAKSQGKAMNATIEALQTI